MEKHQVIKLKNLPPRLPVTITALAYIFLDKFDAVGWVWGTAWTLLGIVWIITIVAMFTCDYKDVFQK